MDSNRQIVVNLVKLNLNHPIGVAYPHLYFVLMAGVAPRMQWSNTLNRKIVYMLCGSIVKERPAGNFNSYFNSSSILRLSL
jgi:hypothetical protein